MVTANAQPVVITIQPELLPLVWLRTTFATTPSPRMIRRAVPRNSATRGDMAWRVRAESMVVLERDVHPLAGGTSSPPEHEKDQKRAPPLSLHRWREIQS